MASMFSPGDVVQLKSGGSPMTVVGYDKHRLADVRCHRSEDMAANQILMFPEASLQLVRRGAESRTTISDIDTDT